MPELTFRTCTAEDLRRFEEEGISRNALYWRTRRFQEQVSGDALYVLAFRDAHFAGRVSLTFRSKYPEVNEKFSSLFELNGLEATPTGQGTGSALINWCEQAARDRGAQMMGIAVSVENSDATRLYARVGYAEWDQGTINDEWYDLDAEGNATIKQSDLCRYLTKKL